MKDIFYVQIVSCQRHTFWYSRKVGEVFRVEGSSEDGYIVEGDGYYIEICDGEIVSSLEDVVSRI